MIVVQPVLEVYAFDGFSLWPVTEFESYGFLPLSGALSTVRLTVDLGKDDGPVIEIPVDELRRLLNEVEQDLIGFADLVADWAAQHVPDHAAAARAAVARALDLRDSQ